MEQTIEGGARATEDKTRSRPPPRGPWSERHGSEQQVSATRFAVPSFLFAEPALAVGHAVCACTAIPSSQVSQLARSGYSASMAVPRFSRSVL